MNAGVKAAGEFMAVAMVEKGDTISVIERTALKRAIPADRLENVGLERFAGNSMGDESSLGIDSYLQVGI